MKKGTSQEVMEAGTGFAASLFEVLKGLQARGYTENLAACYDHFESQQGRICWDPEHFEIDELVRFENTSDPDDQAILFAVRQTQPNGELIRGVFIDSFGIYHEELSPKLELKLRQHPH